MARSLTALICFACLQLGCGAADEKTEPPKAQTASSSEQNPIDLAKSQFQHSQQQTKAFPEQSSKAESLVMPSFQMPGSGSLYEFLKQRKAVDKRKDKARKNWLVDGVLGSEGKDKQATSKSQNLDSQSSRTKADQLVKETDEGVEGVFRSEEGIAKIPESSKKESVVLNVPQVDPLQQYMEIWMSPKDFDLLVRPSAGSSRTNPVGVAWKGPVGAEDLQLVATAENGKGGGFPASPSVAATNPFLKAMEGWTPVQAPQTGAFAPTQPPLVIEPEGINRSQTQPTKMSQKELQGLFKPADDRKVFPQLKRF